MRSMFGPLALTVILGIVAHFGIIHYAPTFIMDRAYTMLGERGTPVHGFNLAPQMRPDTQSVVRPSPDLAYSGCRFDMTLATGGIRVTMAAYDGYSSLSFFDAQTNNFKTVRGEGKEQTIILRPSGAKIADNISAISPSTRGIILIRRLAPTAQDYERVVEVAADDKCEAL